MEHYVGSEAATGGVISKKGVLKNSSGPRVCNFIKKRLQHRCFHMNIAKSLRAPILKSICKRLLL